MGFETQKIRWWVRFVGILSLSWVIFLGQIVRCMCQLSAAVSNGPHHITNIFLDIILKTSTHLSIQSPGTLRSPPPQSPWLFTISIIIVTSTPLSIRLPWQAWMKNSFGFPARLGQRSAVKGCHTCVRLLQLIMVLKQTIMICHK